MLPYPGVMPLPQAPHPWNIPPSWAMPQPQTLQQTQGLPAMPLWWTIPQLQTQVPPAMPLWWTMPQLQQTQVPPTLPPQLQEQVQPTMPQAQEQQAQAQKSEPQEAREQAQESPRPEGRSHPYIDDDFWLDARELQKRPQEVPEFARLWFDLPKPTRTSLKRKWTLRWMRTTSKTTKRSGNIANEYLSRTVYGDDIGDLMSLTGQVGAYALLEQIRVEDAAARIERAQKSSNRVANRTLTMGDWKKKKAGVAEEQHEARDVREQHARIKGGHDQERQGSAPGVRRRAQHAERRRSALPCNESHSERRVT